MTSAAGDGQQEVIAFLSSPRAYGAIAGPVERIDTHISVVWLVGPRAYKLKRAVRFDYVDFSTLERRRVACEAEVRVNRRTAPSIYLGARPVTRAADGSLAVSGDGVPVDWVVEMTRFDDRTLFDRLAEQGRLDVSLMAGLADAIANLHRQAEVCRVSGGYDGMAWVVDGNALDFDGERAAAILGRPACEQWTRLARAALGESRARLDKRAVDGRVRSCHGDLHLRNICLIDGTPTLFDGVEFNENISCIDVWYDVAFLLMDLWRRGLRPHANSVFNEYLARTMDVGGLPLLPLFLSCRAAVRAKTSVAAAAVQQDDERVEASERAAREYLALAQRLLAPTPARLVAVGGFSGSGKTTLARGLAPDVGAPPGALILRSDVIRKALCGVTPLTPLGPQGYAPEVTIAVYRTIAERAGEALRAGHAVIADAVYADGAERGRIAAVAHACGVPFTGLWIHGPEALLAERLRQRVGDASDATEDVLRGQLRVSQGPIEWHQLDGSGDPARVRSVAAACLDAGRS